MGKIGLLGLAIVAVLCTAAPAWAEPIPADFYGTWGDHLSQSREAQRAELERQRATGVAVIRQHIFWDRVERTPGHYDWSRLDELVGDAADAGLTILPVLLQPPAFHTARPAGSDPGVEFPPKEPGPMAAFAEAMVRRYGPNGKFWCPDPPLLQSRKCRTAYRPITAWQVWNEPDYPSWWAGKPDPGAYAALLVEVAKAIRKAHAEAEVIMGGLTWPQASLAGGFLDELYAKGAVQHADSIAVHAFGKSSADVIAVVRRVRERTAAHNDGARPIRVTEYAWATGGAGSDLIVSEGCQAALLHDTTARLAAVREELNIRSIVQFQWRDAEPRSPAWPFYAGLLRTDGSAKPALQTFADAVAGRPAPSGLSPVEACPPDRRGATAPASPAAHANTATTAKKSPPAKRKKAAKKRKCTKSKKAKKSKKRRSCKRKRRPSRKRR